MEILYLFIGALFSWIIAHYYYRRSALEEPKWAAQLLKKLHETTNRADAVGLLATTAQSAATPNYSFELMADEDPILALAGLRIEIEKRLTQLAEANNISAQRAGVSRLLKILGERGLLSNEEGIVLADLVGLLNIAVHGGKVDKRITAWGLDAGKRFLVGLDRRSGKE